MMAIRAIDNWKGQSFFATRFFAPLAVAATRGDADACRITARVVFALNGKNAAYLFGGAVVAR
jgi:hypothetical protein